MLFNLIIIALVFCADVNFNDTNYTTIEVIDIPTEGKATLQIVDRGRGTQNSHLLSPLNVWK